MIFRLQGSFIRAYIGKIVCAFVVYSSAALPSFANEMVKKTPSLWSLTDESYKSVSHNGVESSYGVAVNLHELAFGRLKENAIFRLPVFHGTLNVQLGSANHVGEMTIWRAKNLAASHLPTTLIFVKQGNISAWIPTRNGTYRLRDGRLYKEVKMGGQTSDIKVPPQSVSDLPTALTSKTEHRSHAKNTLRLAAQNRSQAAGDNQYRVLFVVTNEFLGEFPDTENTINEYIAANNAIYEASGMNVELINAGLLQADLEQFTPDQILDNISGSTSSDSTDGQISNDLLQPIWDARLSNSADFITVFVNDLEDGLCGQGWLNGDQNQVYNYNFAVNVTAAFTVFSGNNRQSCSIDTLGHELGHNMGLGHSLQQGSEGTVFTWGRGYGINDQFTTVMAYPQQFGSAEGLAFFSSPNLTCLDDFPCGVASSQSDGADAVAAVNQVKEEISLIHNDETTLPINEAISEFDTELQQCILSANPDIITNEQLSSVNCPNEEIASFSGMEKLPKLTFISVSAVNTDLTPFLNLHNIDVLDFRASNISNFRPVAHLVSQLRFLQFSAVNISCQDLNVVRSWNIADSFLINDSFCNDLGNDNDDFDGDGTNNLIDVDDDNDGIDDITDHLPFDPSNANDIDADGVADSADAFPYNDAESVDTDNDTVGNNSDSDDDNDGVVDGEDCAPLDKTLSTDCSGNSNQAPSISGTPDISVAEDSQYSFIPGASDSNGDTLSFSIQNQPSWSGFNVTNGHLSGTPGNSDVGEYSNIIISVSDGDLSDSLAAFSITVTNVNDAPNISGAPVLTVTEGRGYEFVPSASDVDGDNLTFSIQNQPSWANFDDLMGALSGIPGTGDIGEYPNIVISVSDGELSASLDPFTITVTAVDEPISRSFVAYDYDGDGKADIGVRRASNFFQYILNSSDDAIQRVQFGKSTGDITVSGDFDGDQIADVAVRRPSNQYWYIKNSSDGEIQRFNFGKQPGDIPVPADYDGDGITDIAVRRPSNFMFYILNSSDGEIQRIRFGLNIDDIPVPADYDGDGKADVAVRRQSNQFWYILNSSDGEIQRINFGKQPTDIPIPADYDGDGKADVAVRRASNFMFYVLNSSDSEIQRIRFGLNENDIPIPADYDGDGKVDVAVRRPANQFQYILRTSDGEIERVQFGRNSADMPLAAPISTRVDLTIPVAVASADSDNDEVFQQRDILSLTEAMLERVR